MTISVIILTHNSFATKKGSLELMLLSLLMQDMSGLILEIIVVNNGSTDRTKDFLVYYSDNSHIPIKVLSALEPKAKSTARNLGAKHSSGEYLLFIDDDMLFPKNNTVMSVVNRISYNSFACGVERKWTYVGWNKCRILQDLLKGSHGYATSISHLPDGIDRDSGYRNLLHVSFLTNFGCLSRALFESAGGFDEKYIGWGRNDCELMYRLLVEHDAKFINCYDCGPIIHINHPVPNRSIELNINEKRYKNLEKKHGFTLRYSHLFGIKENDDDQIIVPLT